MIRPVLGVLLGLVATTACHLEQRPPHELTGARLEEPIAAANLRVVTRMLEEGLDRRDRRLLGELLAPEAILRPAGAGAAGPALERIEADLVRFDSLAAGWHLVVDEVFGTRDRAVARWHLKTPRDSARSPFGAIWITRLDQGRIVEIWEAPDRAAVPPG